MTPKCSTLVFGYPTSNNGFEVERSKVKVSVSIISIWRGFELYECLLVCLWRMAIMQSHIQVADLKLAV